MSRRVVLVGNAPCARTPGGPASPRRTPSRPSAAALIDGADHVVRFNRAHGVGAANGSRTDELYLINHGGQMAEWLENDELPALAAAAATRTVVLPVPMLSGHVTPERARELLERTGVPIDPDRINHLEPARRRLEASGCSVARVDVESYRGAQRALAALGRSPDHPCGEHYPSTGFVALFRTLSAAARDVRVELHGFTFEGWRGHSWALERRWVNAHVARGRLTVHPVR